MHPRSQSHRVSLAPSLGQAQEPVGKVPLYPELPSSVCSSLPPSTLIPSSLAKRQSSYLPLLSHRSCSPVLGTHCEFPRASVLLVRSFPSALHYFIPATHPILQGCTSHAHPQLCHLLQEAHPHPRPRTQSIWLRSKLGRNFHPQQPTLKPEACSLASEDLALPRWSDVEW